MVPTAVIPQWEATCPWRRTGKAFLEGQDTYWTLTLGQQPPPQFSEYFTSWHYLEPLYLVLVVHHLSSRSYLLKKLMKKWFSSSRFQVPILSPLFSSLATLFYHLLTESSLYVCICNWRWCFLLIRSLWESNEITYENYKYIHAQPQNHYSANVIWIQTQETKRTPLLWSCIISML